MAHLIPIILYTVFDLVYDAIAKAKKLFCKFIAQELVPV